MKTMIIYASRYGLTAEAATEIAARLDGEITTINIARDVMPDLDNDDRIIIGSSIYMGQADKQVRQWVQKNQVILEMKKLGFFLCCGLPENFNTYLEQAFGAALTSQAATVCLGGELKTDKMRWMDRFIAGMMTRAAQKEGNPLPERHFERINDFLERLI